MTSCEHYRRRCKIRAPCCDKIFPCRHCHNEAMSSLSNPKEHHELVRRDVNQTSKGQFHCDDCGICRVGGRSEFFHCQECGSCYAVSVQNNHLCAENTMKNYCPVCYEYLFDSIKGSTVMKCGHTMHSDCFHEMAEQSIVALSAPKQCSACLPTGKMLEMEIEANKMPEEYQYDVVINPTSGDINRQTVQKLHLVEKNLSIQAGSAVGMPNCHLKSSGHVIMGFDPLQ
ncbi:hypothetical protein Ddye_016829 [Dipteronia dyeriana]|uniref:Uncharacterized protein n=1 Tax=Dipteronia dyeriana TaxID=168575 RepID=A0AAD9U7F8_9ROSI|nr:hypothetical protein Ddye_016829 [Dipteronia dyeriana]